MAGRNPDPIGSACARGHEGTVEALEAPTKIYSDAARDRLAKLATASTDGLAKISPAQGDSGVNITGTLHAAPQRAAVNADGLPTKPKASPILAGEDRSRTPEKAPT